jgi:hypothetical protein
MICFNERVLNESIFYNIEHGEYSYALHAMCLQPEELYYIPSKKIQVSQLTLLLKSVLVSNFDILAALEE